MVVFLFYLCTDSIVLSYSGFLSTIRKFLPTIHFLTVNRHIFLLPFAPVQLFVLF